MRATSDQIDYLNRLLGLLSGGYRARVDPEDADYVLVEYTIGHGDAASYVSSHLSLAWTGPSVTEEGGLDGNAPAWSVACAVTSGGSRMDPPDVDVYEAHPPARWEQACRNLIVSLFTDLVDTLDEARGEEEMAKREAEAAEGYEPDDPPGGLDPFEPEGWDNSTGKE